MLLPYSFDGPTTHREAIVDVASSEFGGYDAALHQYRERPPLNVGRLLFERWLIDNGRSEHAPASEVHGELIFHAADYTTAHPSARRAWIPADWSRD